ncbi:MAG TPA: phosphatase PAP2 family protein [Actinomycetota bacterium]
MRRRWFPVVGGAAAAVIAVISARGRGQALDRRVYGLINSNGSRAADTAFKTVTEFGSIWAAGGAAVVLSARGRRREGADAFGAALAMWGLGQVLKRLVGRPRPYAALDDFRLLIEKPRGTTWPSSHPAVFLAFTTVASRDLDIPVAAKAGVLCFAGVVGLSRIYLGVHYPADVAGGLLLGRSLADVWSAVVSPAVLGRVPRVAAPVQ